MISVSQELNSQRKNAFTVRPIVTTSRPVSALEELVVDLVAVVQRAVGLEVHDHRLGADRERAGEHVEAVDRALQVHQPLAGLVVARGQLRASRTWLTPTQAPPSNGFMNSG